MGLKPGHEQYPQDPITNDKYVNEVLSEPREEECQAATNVTHDEGTEVGRQAEDDSDNRVVWVQVKVNEGEESNAVLDVE